MLAVRDGMTSATTPGGMTRPVMAAVRFGSKPGPAGMAWVRLMSAGVTMVRLGSNAAVLLGSNADMGIRLCLLLHGLRLMVYG